LASVKVDTEQLKAVDAGIWAESNGINLLGGRFSFAGREFQMEMMRDRSRRQCAMKGAQLGGVHGLVCVEDSAWGDPWAVSVGCVVPVPDAG
jgi:hypothetical protein